MGSDSSKENRGRNASRPSSGTVEQPTVVQSPSVTQTTRIETQTPPPSYSEVQYKYDQSPQVSYQQQNAYPHIPISPGHYPHNYQQQYGVYHTNPYVTNYPAPQQFQSPHFHNVVPGPNPSGYNQPPPINPFVKTDSGKIARVEEKNKTKANEIILNLDNQSNIKKTSNDPNFGEFAKQLNKIKFKPLSEARKSLVNNRYLSDIKFVINNEIIYVHKLFLATSSAKFHKHFHVDGNVEMKIEEIDKNTFVEVISYCYTGHLKITEENVLGLLLAANKLEVRQLTNMCSGFVNNMMNAETIFVIFEKAIEHKSEDFQKKCLNFITKNEEKCFQSKGFYDISLPSLMIILNVLKFTTEKSNQLIEKWTNGYVKTNEPTPPPPPQKSTGAVKKPQKNKKIPSLMDIPPPPPEFAKFYETNKPTRPFAEENLINFDDDDDVSGIICKDDSDGDLTSEISFGGHPEKRTTFVIKGTSESYKTEFSRIDFMCMKSINVHEIWFNANLFSSNEFKSMRLTVMLDDEGKKTNIHSRVVKRDLKPGMKLNYVKFSKKPLQFFFGQKWFIKINFSESAKRAHLQPTKIAPLGTLNVVNDTNKKYFNCINKIVVSEIN